MKPNAYIPVLFIIGLFAASCASSKLPVKNIYAYKQGTTSGVAPSKTINESGVEHIIEKQRSYNYFFYIESSAPEIPDITDLWIDGKRFEAKTEQVNNTPVVRINKLDPGIPDSTILVPATKNYIFLVYPAGISNKEQIDDSRLLKEQPQPELIIGYGWKGKKYYKSLGSIKVLASATLQ